MASVSITSSFPPQALARSNTPNPNHNSKNSKFNRNTKLKPQRAKHKSAPSLITLTGGEATTYTRLPPREDFTVPLLGNSPQSSSTEVKLSDSGVAKMEDETEVDRSSIEKGEESKNSMEFNLHEDYGRFQVFGVGSDFDEEEEEADYETVNGGTVNIYEGNGFGEEEGGEIEGVKEKGVPAVMRCFDSAKIYVKAGDGGNGVVAFRREKFVPMGGPSGGDGGRGGNVYLEVDGSMNSLLPFRNGVHFRAGRGAHGQGMMQNGAKGEDVVVKVAPGTVVREAGREEVLLELLYPGQRALLLPGGRGGRGNAAFKSGSNKVPRIAENGEEGPEMWLELELKLVADVGIVGAPNAGKSTLLSVISAAQPQIANYPFTTLLPNLGVVSFDYDSTMVVADLPGLLEGAHRGFGLGHEFLRHTERLYMIKLSYHATSNDIVQAIIEFSELIGDFDNDANSMIYKDLVHVVDGSSPQPELEFDAVRLELELFSPELAEKPYIVAYNKMDLPDAYGSWLSFKEKLQTRGVEPFCMSAIKREGIDKVIRAAYELLRKSKEANKEFEGCTNSANLNHVADMVQKQRRARIDDFEISHDSSSRTWHVTGLGLQRFVQMTNWRYIDSERRFQHVLEACGVNKSLMKLGVKEGDTVIVGEMEMVWNDSPQGSGSSNTKKGPFGSMKWPQRE